MSYVRDTLMLHSVVPDLIPQDAPADAWNSCENVIFRNNECLRVFGDSIVLPTSQTPLTMVFLGADSTAFWVYASENGVFAHDGSIEYDITPTTWAAVQDGTVFTSCVLNGIVYINGSDRDPVYWGGDINTPCDLLPDWPSGGRCLAMRAHKNFLFAIGFLSEGSQRVRWSDAAEAGTIPQHWTPAADNLAGFLDLAPLASPCVDGATLRDSFVIYKRESVWSFDFIGGNAVFRAREMFSEHGLANTNGITRGIDDVHLFVGGDGDVYLTDGVKVQSVLDGRAQRTFYNDYAQNTPQLYSAATLSREKVGFIIYPTAGNAAGNRALVYDFISGDIGFRDMPDVLCAAEGGRLQDTGNANIWDGDTEAWDDDGAAWPFEVTGQTLDDVLVGGAFGIACVSVPGSEDFITGAVSARLDKSGLAFGNPQRRKQIARVWPKVTGRTGDALQIRLGGQETTSGPVSLSPPVTFTIGQDMSVDTFISGRFLSMEVTSEGGAPWRLGSIDVEYREVGAF